MRRVVLVIAVLAVGCVTIPQPVQHLAVYDESALAWANAPGTAVVTGQAFLKTLGGDVKYAAGNPVYMLPVSDYTTEWFDAVIVRGTSVTSAADTATGKFERVATADGAGKFRFTGVAAGKYYLWSAVYWSVASYGGLSQTGGQAYATITVAAGDSVNAILTR